MARMLFQGHASLRFTTDAGQVVYVDPYFGEGYDFPADMILVTHQHFDHNQTHLIAQKQGCLVVTEKDALANGKYHRFQKDGIEVRALPASNKNHKREECVGYLLHFDGLTVYCAGDTSYLPEMAGLKELSVDYALLPIDGFYNMDAAEASRCAEVIGARHSIPIHTAPDNGKDIRDGFGDENAGRFVCPGRLIVHHGEEIEL